MRVVISHDSEVTASTSSSAPKSMQRSPHWSHGRPQIPTPLFRQPPNMNGCQILKNTGRHHISRGVPHHGRIGPDTPAVLATPQPSQVGPPLPLKLAQRRPHREPVMQPRSNIANTKCSPLRHNRAPQTHTFCCKWPTESLALAIPSHSPLSMLSVKYVQATHKHKWNCQHRIEV